MEQKAKPRYFVAGMVGGDPRPVPEAEFQIQILNELGQGEFVAYFNYASNEPVGFEHALQGCVAQLDQKIPIGIVEASRTRCNWPGYYLNEDGEVTEPPFIVLTKARLEAAREKDRRRRGFFKDK